MYLYIYNVYHSLSLVWFTVKLELQATCHEIPPWVLRPLRSGSLNIYLEHIIWPVVRIIRCHLSFKNHLSFAARVVLKHRFYCMIFTRILRFERKKHIDVVYIVLLEVYWTIYLFCFYIYDSLSPVDVREGVDVWIHALLAVGCSFGVLGGCILFTNLLYVKVGKVQNVAFRKA